VSKRDSLQRCRSGAVNKDLLGPCWHRARKLRPEDHAELYDTLVARRYFAKFDRITGHLGRVAAEVETEGKLTRTEARVLGATSRPSNGDVPGTVHKYLMTGRGDTAPRLTIDRHESGFPVAQELMTMAVDAAQVEKHLGRHGGRGRDQGPHGAPDRAGSDRADPAAIRPVAAVSTMKPSQRVACSGRATTPTPSSSRKPGARRHFLIHWAVWDTQTNLPVVYLIDVQDSGKKPLPDDDRRWPQVSRA
jgi:hypothetical protein